MGTKGWPAPYYVRGCAAHILAPSRDPNPTSPTRVRAYTRLGECGRLELARAAARLYRAREQSSQVSFGGEMRFLPLIEGTRLPTPDRLESSRAPPVPSL